MSRFVLVPGAWHGGWWYEPVVDALSADGHQAVAVTPAGLGPDDDLTKDVVNLDTHVAQVAAEVLAGDGPATLVGHSYGGMVITAVADRMPERIRALVYLDADVPRDGESSWDVAPDYIRASLIDGAGETGVSLAPLPFFDDRARPHPLATLLQRVRLTGAWERVPIKRFAAALDTPGGLQAPTAMERVRNDPDWHYEEWPTTHNVLRDGPGRVLSLLTDL
ncbi:alpha/beta fold hydrolase [Actinoplanes sp. NPDC051633]|uniref:alpha/beta hydrolase n=1 Tax=Actinoplanes sp. NPDC051633 TaxID=3155670 RepID=UPI0034430CCD